MVGLGLAFLLAACGDQSDSPSEPVDSGGSAGSTGSTSTSGGPAGPAGGSTVGEPSGSLAGGTGGGTLGASGGEPSTGASGGPAAGTGGTLGGATGGGSPGGTTAEALGGTSAGGAGSNSGGTTAQDLGGTSGGDGSGGASPETTGGSSAAQSGGTAGGPTGGTTGTETGGTTAEDTGGTAASDTGGAGAAGEEQYTIPDSPPLDEDGSELWLRYPEVVLPGRLAEYRAALTHVVEAGDTPTLQAAEAELVEGLSGLTGVDLPVSGQPEGAGAVVLGTPESSSIVGALPLSERLGAVGSEGYVVEVADVQGQPAIVVAANTDVGVLYGSYALLRHIQSHRSLGDLALTGAPKIRHRVLNHWDNLDGGVERGYAGKSLWNWSALPGTLSPRYEAYARANASIGINGTVLTNVNADAQVLTTQYLDKVAALADVFRPYGIAVYLTARFSAPVQIGGLSTADPLSNDVRQWWASKADEIYQRIPDFGGFLVKANSEGQPGPQDYGRTHADGANMLAEAVGAHGGVVMWRAFVYSDESPTDRIRQAYDEFHPLDGQFAENVLVQVKNGPLDFQPREPFSPLFGAMAETPLALELQVTKEYLGQDTHLAYLGTLFEEVLDSDTYASGAGSTVARVIDGSLHGHTTSAIAGVSNVGNDANWTGSHFNQANWYAYGRLAWDPDLSAEEVAEEWVRQTLSNDPAVVAPVTEMMMGSREAVVNYMTPLGLAHIMASDHHYGPGPWVDNLSRAEWNPVYYHRADAQGIGFDRTASGSDAIGQYFDPVRQELGSRDTVPENLLLFFHHVGWQDSLESGRTLWDELVHRYSLGVDTVGEMRESWSTVEGRIDAQRFEEVSEFLEIQHYEARWWRDACLQYFRQFANLQISADYAQPANQLSFYQGLNCAGALTSSKPRCSPVYTGEPSPAILR